MNQIPNILTISRFFITLGFIYGIQAESWEMKLLGFVFFVVAALTDWLDGYLARKWNLITAFGKIMDPIADKFLTLSAFCIFTMIGVMEGWMLIVILIREVGLTGYRFWAMSQKKVLAAESWGKVKTVIQMIMIIMMLIFLILQASPLATKLPKGFFGGYMFELLVMMYVTVAITVVSGVSFLKNNIGKK